MVQQLYDYSTYTMPQYAVFVLIVRSTASTSSPCSTALTRIPTCRASICTWNLASTPYIPLHGGHHVYWIFLGASTMTRSLTMKGICYGKAPWYTLLMGLKRIGVLVFWQGFSDSWWFYRLPAYHWVLSNGNQRYIVPASSEWAVGPARWLTQTSDSCR